MSKKTYDITPDISLMPKLGKSGYTSPQAIAELVDNSIDARIDKETLEVNIKIDKNIISVADNGYGMNQEQLAKALTLAYSKKENKLGEFGLGLKTSCNSLGAAFEVITTPTGDDRQYRVIFNQSEWLSGKRKWEIEIESSKSDKNLHFTVIKVSKLYSCWPQLAEILKKDLQRRFAPYIEKGDVNIKVNGKKCQPSKYELIDGSKKDFRIKIQKGICKGKVITGWYGLLKEGSQKGLYGFHTYRRGRMITLYDKIAIGEHPMISRIIGEVNLDFVPVTHNKKEFLKESEEYIIAEEYLKEEFKELLKKAREKSSQDKITKNVKDDLDVWKEKICQAIKAPELKFYTSQIDPKTGMVKDEDGREEEIAAEIRDGEHKTEGSVKVKETNITRIPKKKSEENKKIIKIKGKTFEFDHQFSSMGSESSWKDWKLDKGKKKLLIFSNTDFPAYIATKDPVFYAVVHIAEAVSEVMVKEVGEEIGNIQDIKETILRIASNLKLQISNK